MLPEVTPRSRWARYGLALLGLVPLAEITYVAGPKALLFLAKGVLIAGAVAWRIIALEQSQRAREGTEANRLHSSSTRAPGDDGAA
jgi:hypothetical protein